MYKLNLPPWLSSLLYLGTITAAVTVTAWGGPKLKVWSFFTKTTSPASSSIISGTISNPQQKPEWDQDCTSTSFESESPNRLDGTPENEGKRKTPAERYREYEINKRKALIRELESLINISTSKTALLEPDWNYLIGVGFSEESISSMDETFRLFAVEQAIRNKHRSQIQLLQNEINEYLTNPGEPTEEEKQKQKKEICLLRILRRKEQIREINLLITKSTAITTNRKEEWESTLTATARRAKGIRKRIIMDHTAFKQLEADKVQVLAGEQASRTTHRAKVRVLQARNEKDKNTIININTILNIGKPKEAASLPRE